MNVHTLRLKVSNAILVCGDRPILIDSGAPGDLDRLQQALKAHRVRIEDLAAIVHTHGHSDHVGTTAQLLARSNPAVLLHRADQPITEQGHNNTLHPTSMFGYVLRKFVNAPFEAFAPTIAIDAPMRLDNFGVGGQIVPLPGHTAGSAVVLLDDGQAVVGDLFRGGFMGGVLAPSIPKPHYFADDRPGVRRAIADILQHDISTFHVGHGGPIPAAKVRAKWADTPRRATTRAQT
jgi:hydroxyacylglutathione hydrolase